MNETLEHHGILGMKWGVRRYQNKDGTWTKEGKEHRNPSVKDCKKEYNELRKQRNAYYDKYGMDLPEKESKELDSIDERINSLIEGRYSEAVFREYNEKQPELIRNHTGEEVSWKDAFGDSYENTTKGNRHSLVGLVEGGTGQYRFKSRMLGHSDESEDDIASNNSPEDFLAHHGILGMKWGVRRYQNKDGTWTKEGKEHRAEGGSQESPESTANEGSVASSKTMDQTVQDISKKLLTEREMMNTNSQRSINAAKTGLNCIKAARPWDGDDFDPEDKGDQEWFLIEDQTFGLPQIADLANQGYDEKEINKMISDGLEAYENSKYAEGFNGDKGTDVSGLWYLTMSGYGDGWYSSYISDYIRECANYAKDETKHSDDSSEDILSHHGILGMKWGVRRYQNKDGSLTAAGRKRYGDDVPDGNKSSSGDASNSTPRTPAKSASEMTDQELNQALNRLRMEQQYNELTGAKSSNQYQNQQNFSTPPSNTGNLSNAELQAYINRLDMEKRYKQLTTPPPKELNMGQKFVKEILPAVALEVGRELVKNTMRKALGLEKSNDGSDNDGGGKKNKNNNNNDGGKQKNYDKQFNETNSRIDKLANAINNLANNKQNSKSESKSSDSSGDEEKSSTSIVPYSEHRKSIIGGAKAATDAAREKKKNRDALMKRLSGYRADREFKRDSSERAKEEVKKRADEPYSDYYRSMWTYGM